MARSPITKTLNSRCPRTPISSSHIRSTSPTTCAPRGPSSSLITRSCSPSYRWVAPIFRSGEGATPGSRTHELDAALLVAALKPSGWAPTKTDNWRYTRMRRVFPRQGFGADIAVDPGFGNDTGKGYGVMKIGTVQFLPRHSRARENSGRGEVRRRACARVQRGPDGLATRARKRRHQVAKTKRERRPSQGASRLQSWCCRSKQKGRVWKPALPFTSFS